MLLRYPQLSLQYCTSMLAEKIAVSSLLKCMLAFRCPSETTQIIPVLWSQITRVFSSSTAPLQVRCLVACSHEVLPMPLCPGGLKFETLRIRRPFILGTKRNVVLVLAIQISCMCRFVCISFTSKSVVSLWQNTIVLNCFYLLIKGLKFASNSIDYMTSE
ncbi:uncharacterized protein LOC117651065 [Thrips palmi]|uniref:Uncharacterized protein LOC117651065 n=1 Tax=Thrips palmi TaxID=161013 RepID=A0A6P8ZZ25_THRPL|nr:uncharacterized protein LOC117651065 [Thrips palmi]